MTRAQCLACCILACAPMTYVHAGQPGMSTATADQPAAGFATRDGSVAQLIQAIGARLEQGVVVSEKARRKRLDGDFDLAKPRRLLDDLAHTLGMIWFSDGRTLYVYDASETESRIMRLEHIDVAELERFLAQSQLADPRYPLRGGAHGTFYVSGPPAYVRVVERAAHELDRVRPPIDASIEQFEVIRLEHTFAAAHSFRQRGEQRVVPGMVDVVRSALAQSQSQPNARATIDPPVSPEETSEWGAKRRRRKWRRLHRSRLPPSRRLSLPMSRVTAWLSTAPQDISSECASWLPSLTGHVVRWSCRCGSLTCVAVTLKSWALNGPVRPG